jgi:hypothetical protein
MKAPSVPAALALSAVLLSCALPVLAGVLPPMLPLEIGNHWEYQSLGGDHQVETITGTATVLGRAVFVKHYAEGLNAGLENWWRIGPGGDVQLAGFDRHDGFSLGYDPPLTFCGASPVLGDLWPTHVVAYDMATMAVYAEFDITFSALEDVSLSVPAGTFPSIGVGQVLAKAANPVLALRGLALDGRQLKTTPNTIASDATDWFSAGVGEVQYRSGDTYLLVSYGYPTPTLTTSWGALKRTYR